jgi:hypothetical protein
VFAALSWTGISRLATEVPSPGLLGWEIGKFAFHTKDIVSWVLEHQQIVGWAQVDAILRGVLAGMTYEKRAETLDLAISELEAKGLQSAIPNLLISAPFMPEIWNLLETKDPVLQDRYWKTVNPGLGRLESFDMSTAVKLFIKHGRARSAFQLVMYKPTAIDSLLLKKILDSIRSGEEADGPLPEGWHIEQAIHAIQNDGKVSQRELAILEFSFFKALRYTEHGAQNLYAEMLTDPSLFVECVTLIYKPRNDDLDSVSESLDAAADVAWNVLHSGRGIPGAKPDGGIDKEQLDRWITEMRQLALESAVSEKAAHTIGEWLSDCQPDSDGMWPPAVVAEVLDDDQNKDLLKGFYYGVLNNRGMTSRSMGEGGAQERELASVFRKRVSIIVDRFPRVADVLVSVASSYEQQARREDEQANLRSEGL